MTTQTILVRNARDDETEAPAISGRCTIMVSRNRNRGAAMSIIADRRGGVAVLVGFVIVGLVGMLALAIDVSAAISAHARLRQAADIAALAAVRQAAIDTAKDADASLANAVAAGTQRFLAQASVIPKVGPSQPVVTVTRSGLTIRAKVIFNTSYQTQIAGALNGISANYAVAASIPLSGVATAKQTVGSYVDVQVLMDVSNSMTIVEEQPPVNGYMKGADLFRFATNFFPMWYNQGGAGWQGCTVACHAALGEPYKIAPAWNYSGNPPLNGSNDYPWLASIIPTPNPSGAPGANESTYDPRTYDYYEMARYFGVPMRIDSIKKASASIATAVSTTTDPDRFRFGFYTFDLHAQQVYPLGAASPAVNVINGVEVTPFEGGYPSPATPAQTNVGGSIGEFTSNWVAPAGDGSSQAHPKKYVVIITDGVEDYNEGPNRVTAPFDDSTCARLKAPVTAQPTPGRAAAVFVLQAADKSNFNSGGVKKVDGTYVTLDVDQMYNASVAAMTACASSPDYYFLASNPDAIATAAQQIINLALSQPTLLVQSNGVSTGAAGPVAGAGISSPDE